MKIELTKNQSIVNDIAIIEAIRILTLSKYFSLVVTKEILQEFYDDINAILDKKNYSELEVGFCPLRNKLWADFNSSWSDEKNPIYLEF